MHTLAKQNVDVHPWQTESPCSLEGCVSCTNASVVKNASKASIRSRLTEPASCFRGPNKEKSFQLLSKIYEKQNQWAVGSDIVKINKSLKKIGLEFGLENKIIENYLKDENIQDQILNERIKAQKNYKIESTPTIYINKNKYEGDHNFKSFKKAIDKLL